MPFRSIAVKPAQRFGSACFTLAVFAALFSSCVNSSFAAPAADDYEKPEPVVGKVQVQARPEIVFEAIRCLRQEDPGGVKVLSHNLQNAMIEEIFDGLPIVGKAKCLYKESYLPPNKVEFHMVESDKLKAFDGWWKLTPVSAVLTEVELATGVDFGLHIPFARQITNANTLKEIREQLADMKRLAERKQQAALHPPI